MEVFGTLQPSQAWMTYKIPVESGTKSLKVTINPLGSQEGPVPELDQLYLVGPSGVILSMLKGAARYATGARQAMMILLSAVPDNSMLLVRIVETPPPTVAAVPPQASLAALNVPFSMDVQRSDLAISALPINAQFQTVAETGLMEPLLVAYTDVSATIYSRSPGTASDIRDMEEVSLELTGTASSTVAIVAAGEWVTTHVELSTPGISVGPLVSRGSAPLRPLLGTMAGEPTPSIDRNERAFDLAPLGSEGAVDAELLLSLTANRSDGNGEDFPVIPAARTPGPLIAMRGPGGLRMIVSSMRASQALIDSAAVLATLTAPESLRESAQQLAGLPAIQPIDIHDDSRGYDQGCSGFLKAACASMLAMGFTAGPLYPDLLALVRQANPRRISLANVPARSCAPRNGPLRRCRRWLGLC